MSQHDLRLQHSGNRGYLWTPAASKALPAHLFDRHVLFACSLYFTLVRSPGCTWLLPFLPFKSDGRLKRSTCFKNQQELSPSLRQSADCYSQVLVTTRGYVQSTPAFIDQLQVLCCGSGGFKRTAVLTLPLSNKERLVCSKNPVEEWQLNIYKYKIQPLRRYSGACLRAVNLNWIWEQPF